MGDFDQRRHQHSFNVLARDGARQLSCWCLMLTVKQAAEKLGVSPALVYALCTAREIRHTRIGLRRGRLMIPEDAITEYQARRTVAAKAEAPKEPPPPRPTFKHLSLS